jgi:uncharacterized membrane protein (DUF485 family)
MVTNWFHSPKDFIANSSVQHSLSTFHSLAFFQIYFSFTYLICATAHEVNTVIIETIIKLGNKGTENSLIQHPSKARIATE